ncbi:jg25517, partial [Pararge aegeria aegeria]
MFSKVCGVHQSALGQRGGLRPKPLLILRGDPCSVVEIFHFDSSIICSEELFYETILYDFQNLGLIRLSNPLPLEELFVLGLRSQEEEWNPELGDMRELSQQMCKLLVSKRAMLLEYFSLEVTAQGELSALPLLL